MAKDQFIANMMPHAQRVSAATGIDPRIVVAQAALETGWGKSAPGNNYFGIKSHGKSGGNTLATNEVVNGQTVRINDSFRGYSGMGESADDYGRFLQQNPRYQGLLNADGIESQIAALAKSGYATDPQYGSKIASIASSLGDPVSYTAPQGGGNATMAGGEGQDTMQNTMTPFISTQGQAAPEEPKRWLDPDRRDRLILALEGMTLNPNKGLMMAAAGGLEERREGRKEQAAEQKAQKQRNVTLDMLQRRAKDDPRAAELLNLFQSGTIGIKEVGQHLLQPAADDRTAMEKNYNFLLEQGIPQEQALQMARGGQTINVGGEKQTAGWKKIDETFGADVYGPWVQGGGADALRQIGQLSGVVQKLQSGEAITGPAIGLQPDALQSIFNPEALDAKQRVQDIVQRNLKAILGGAFSEREGQALIERAFDQRLKPEQNAARLGALLQQMESAASAKNAMVDYFNKNGTIQGFEGGVYMPTLDDFTSIFDQIDKKQGIAPAGQGAAAGQPPAPPNVGDTVDGYRFNGGDPIIP